jgi:hypothetical protein
LVGGNLKSRKFKFAETRITFSEFNGNISFITDILTYTPELLLEKLNVSQLVKKFSAFYGTPKVH